MRKKSKKIITEFCRVLTNARSKSGESYNDFSKRVQIPVTSIRNWESEGVLPLYGKLPQIAKAYRIKLSFLRKIFFISNAEKESAINEESSDSPNPLGNFLEAERHKKRFKRTTMALLCGVSLSTIKKIETGNAADWISESTLLKIAKGYSVDINVLINLLDQENLTLKPDNAGQADFIGSYLKGIRTEFSVTLSEVSSAIGLPVPFLSQLENGHAKAPKEMLPLLAEGYRIDVDNLIGLRLEPSDNQLQIDKAFGDWLREKRTRKSLTLGGVAIVSKLSHSFLSKLERGEIVPKEKILKKLSDGYDISINTLREKLQTYIKRV